MLADCVSTRTPTWRWLLVLLVAMAGIVTGSATVLLIAPALIRALPGMGARGAPTTLIRSLAPAIGSSPPSLLALSVDRR